MTHAFSGLLSGSAYERQLERERRCFEEGIAAYRFRVQRAVKLGEPGSLPPARAFLVHWVEALADALRAKIAEFDSGKISDDKGNISPMVPAVLLRFKRREHRLAAIICRVILDSLLGPQFEVRMNDICVRVGEAIVAELRVMIAKAKQTKARKMRNARVAEAKKQNPLAGVDPRLVFNVPEERFVLRELLRMRQRICPRTVNRWCRVHMTDDESQQLQENRAPAYVGAFCFAYARYTCSTRPSNERFAPALELFRVPSKRQKSYVRMVRLAPAVHDVIAQGHSERELLRPIRDFMLVPPVPWDGNVPGGYLTIKSAQIKSISKEHRKAFKQVDLSQFNKRISDISAAPHRIRGRIVDTAKALYERGGGELTLPYLEDLSYPVKPAGYDRSQPTKMRWQNVPEDVVKEYKLRCAEVARENDERRSQRAMFLRRMDMAQRNREEPALYIPHDPDFRGRAYAMVSLLNHQQDDFARAALECAEPRGLGKRGLFWLAVHAANCWENEGIDKKSFAERVKWAHQNATEIARSAKDPIAFDWWRNAKKPWQFLAACMALDDDEAGRHISVGIDGTCNALQHFAALAGDPVAASEVNLIPSDSPNDAYMPVAMEAKQIVQRDAEMGNPEAVMVVGDVDRDIAKTPKFTQYYNVSRYGTRDQILGKLLERGYTKDAALRCSRYLNDVITDVIERQSSAATAVMRWLKDGARAHNEKGQLTGWTSPIGLPVIQAGRKYQKYRAVQLNCYDTEVCLWEPLKNPVPKNKAQINGVAANYVHSIDASHALMVAGRCVENHLWFSAVHDQFNSHAGSIDELAYIVRDEFVKIHTLPLLDRLYNEWTAKGIELAPPPQKGQFDVSVVMQAEYAFS